MIELEASKHDISHQNQQLKEHMSVLLSKIQDLENSMATQLSSEKSKSKGCIILHNPTYCTIIYIQFLSDDRFLFGGVACCYGR